MKQIPQDKLEALLKPLPKEAIKPHPTKNYLSTIKAIYVTERFSEVFGVNGWSIKTDMLHHFTTTTAKGKTEYNVVSKTILTVPEYDIVHECIAGSSNEDFGDAAKGATTDAITKIGSYLGVGIDVYKGLGTNVAPKAEAPKSAKAPSNTPKKLEELTPKHKSWDYVKGRLKEGVKLEQIQETFTITDANIKLLTDAPNA